MVFVPPHCWSAKLSESLMGIEIKRDVNATLKYIVKYICSIIVLVLTSILFIVLSAFSATWFSKQEG